MKYSLKKNHTSLEGSSDTFVKLRGDKFVTGKDVGETFLFLSICSENVLYVLVTSHHLGINRY